MTSLMQTKLRTAYAVLGRKAPFSSLWLAGVTFVHLEVDIRPLEIEYTLRARLNDNDSESYLSFRLLELDPVLSFILQRFNDYVFEDSSPDPSTTHAILTDDGLTRTMF